MGFIKENLNRLQERIVRAAAACGRDPGEIELVAATKYATAEQIREAVEAGVRVIGENRVQDAVKKYAVLGPAAAWHFIGHLQRNKIKDIISWVEMIQSLDSLDLARELDKRAARVGRTVEVLVQVSVAGEAGKFGLPPEAVEPLLEEVQAFPCLRVRGLMTIAPNLPDAGAVRPVFRRLRELAARIPQTPQVEMRYLSMGMSQDLEAAIAEGSNMVRVGRALFDPRGRE